VREGGSPLDRKVQKKGLSLELTKKKENKQDPNSLGSVGEGKRTVPLSERSEAGKRWRFPGGKKKGGQEERTPFERKEGERGHLLVAQDGKKGKDVFV